MKDKDKIRSLLSDINTSMGEGLISFASDVAFEEADPFPAGSHYIDECTGINGWPIGRQVEIAGSYSAGKTHIAMQAMIQIQRQGGQVAFIDAEHSFDTERAADLGLNIESTILAKPDWLEKGLDVIEQIVPICDLIVFDSIGGASTRKEYEGTAEDEDMGVRAKRLTRTVPKIGTLCDRHKCTMIWINQKRSNLSHIPSADHNNTPGGNNFMHQMTMRLFVKTGAPIKHKEERIGHFIKANMVKNKLAPPFKTAEIPFLYEYGICNEWEIIEIGIDKGVLKKSGSYVKHNDVTLGQGLVNAVLFLKDNPELFEQIKDEINSGLLIQE